MTLNNIDLDEIREDINFIIRYCDLYIKYCHEENLLIDGDLNAEIYDIIYEVEDIINDDEASVLNRKDELAEYLRDINTYLTSINDIDIFNHIHLIFTFTINELITKFEK